MNIESASRISLFSSIAMLIFALRKILAGQLISFLLAGVIPGTSIALPYWMMPIIYVGLAFIAIWLVRKFFPTINHANRLPHRRYSQI